MPAMFSETTTIEATRERVFDTITCWGGSSASELQDVELLEGDHGEDATVRYRLASFGWTLDYTLRFTVERPTSVKFHLVDSSVLKSMSGTYELKPADDAHTLCSFSLDVVPRVPLPSLLKRRIARRIVDRSLLDLHAEVRERD